MRSTDPLGEHDSRMWRTVLAASGLYALVVGTLAILRYESVASDFDHGIFSQYVWLFGHLHEPFNTINLRTLLGDHVEPVMILLAPLGALGVGAVGLLVVQTLALAATAPLLYLLAREYGARGWVAATPALLWCASPVVIHVAFHDFHPEALVPALLVAGGLALARGRSGWFLATAVLACATKEDVALTYAALGLVLVWTGRRRLGGLLAAAATAWSLVAVLVVLPAFGNAAKDEFGPRFAGERGDSFADALHYMVVHPLTTVSHAVTPNTIGIGTLLVATTGGLCLLAPRWLLGAAPSIGLNIFSWYDLQQTIDYHYWIVPVGAVALAGAIGAGAVSRAATGTWVRIAASAGVVLALLSLQWMNAISAQIRYEWPKRADRQAVFAAIPSGARVSAPMHALSHLSERKWLFVLPEPFIPVRVGTRWGEEERAEAIENLDYVVFDPGLKAWGSHTDEEIEQAIVQNGFKEILRRGETRLYHREPSR
jgi:uncharacterized membrane protein